MADWGRVVEPAVFCHPIGGLASLRLVAISRQSKVRGMAALQSTDGGLRNRYRSTSREQDAAQLRQAWTKRRQTSNHLDSQGQDSKPGMSSHKLLACLCWPASVWPSASSFHPTVSLRNVLPIQRPSTVSLQ